MSKTLKLSLYELDEILRNMEVFMPKKSIILYSILCIIKDLREDTVFCLKCFHIRPDQDQNNVLFNPSDPQWGYTLDGRMAWEWNTLKWEHELLNREHKWVIFLSMAPLYFFHLTNIMMKWSFQIQQQCLQPIWTHQESPHHQQQVSI